MEISLREAKLVQTLLYFVQLHGEIGEVASNLLEHIENIFYLEEDDCAARARQVRFFNQEGDEAHPLLQDVSIDLNEVEL